ncbi:MAG: TIGR04053 family radical SAM/SPASM domain-containing protein [Firmicutes bacterium]|jgi:radical SAM protein|nr:TIGR04053 family radical SAM/SPASM domain-containing protein [Bacillota bacterium]
MLTTQQYDEVVTSEKTLSPKLNQDGLRQLHFDIDSRPFLVLMELTIACDMACRHCRAESIHTPPDNELTTEDIMGIFDDLSKLGSPRPIVVLSGGDPLQRDDLCDLISYATASGLTCAVSPAGTQRATKEMLLAIREAGAGTVSFSIDGAGPKSHDSFRKVPGSFKMTVTGAKNALEVGLHLQINTTVTKETVYELPGIAHLVAELKANLWSIFFLVPTGRGNSLEPVTAYETEQVLNFLADISTMIPLKTTEAPAYRRIVTRRGLSGQLSKSSIDKTNYPHPEKVVEMDGNAHLYHELHEMFAALGPVESRQTTRHHRAGRSPLAVGDGKGVVFVSHFGEVFPSGFLPLSAGNVKDKSLTEIYATSPLLRSLRNPGLLEGKCGICEMRDTCGGSRAQAYAYSGNPLASDPSCIYQPPAQ